MSKALKDVESFERDLNSIILDNKLAIEKAKQGVAKCQKRLDFLLPRHKELKSLLETLRAFANATPGIPISFLQDLIKAERECKERITNVSRSQNNYPKFIRLIQDHIELMTSTLKRARDNNSLYMLNDVGPEALIIARARIQDIETQYKALDDEAFKKFSGEVDSILKKANAALQEAEKQKLQKGPNELEKTLQETYNQHQKLLRERLSNSPKELENTWLALQKKNKKLSEEYHELQLEHAKLQKQASAMPIGSSAVAAKKEKLDIETFTARIKGVTEKNKLATRKVQLGIEGCRERRQILESRHKKLKIVLETLIAYANQSPGITPAFIKKLVDTEMECDGRIAHISNVQHNFSAYSDRIQRNIETGVRNLKSAIAFDNLDLIKKYGVEALDDAEVDVKNIEALYGSLNDKAFREYSDKLNTILDEAEVAMKMAEALQKGSKDSQDTKGSNDNALQEALNNVKKENEGLEKEHALRVSAGVDKKIQEELQQELKKNEQLLQDYDKLKKANEGLRQELAAKASKGASLGYVDQSMVKEKEKEREIEKAKEKERTAEKERAAEVAREKAKEKEKTGELPKTLIAWLEDYKARTLRALSGNSNELRKGNIELLQRDATETIIPKTFFETFEIEDPDLKKDIEDNLKLFEKAFKLKTAEVVKSLQASNISEAKEKKAQEQVKAASDAVAPSSQAVDVPVTSTTSKVNVVIPDKEAAVSASAKKESAGTSAAAAGSSATVVAGGSSAKPGDKASPVSVPPAASTTLTRPAAKAEEVSVPPAATPKVDVTATPKVNSAATSKVDIAIAPEEPNFDMIPPSPKKIVVDAAAKKETAGSSATVAATPATAAGSSATTTAASSSAKKDDNKPAVDDKKSAAGTPPPPLLFKKLLVADNEAVPLPVNIRKEYDSKPQTSRRSGSYKEIREAQTTFLDNLAQYLNKQEDDGKMDSIEKLKIYIGALHRVNSLLYAERGTWYGQGAGGTMHMRYSLEFPHGIMDNIVNDKINELTQKLQKLDPNFSPSSEACVGAYNKVVKDNQDVSKLNITLMNIDKYKDFQDEKKINSILEDYNNEYANEKWGQEKASPKNS